MRRCSNFVPRSWSLYCHNLPNDLYGIRRYWGDRFHPRDGVRKIPAEGWHRIRAGRTCGSAQAKVYGLCGSLSATGGSGGRGICVGEGCNCGRDPGRHRRLADGYASDEEAAAVDGLIRQWAGLLLNSQARLRAVYRLTVQQPPTLPSLKARLEALTIGDRN